MQKFYELTYIASPILEEKELEALKERIKSFISEQGGKIESELAPVKIKLGYPINKFEEGFLITLEFDYSPEKIEKLEQKIKEESGVLRHLIISKRKRLVRTPKETQKPKKPKKVELKELDKKLKEILEE